MVKICITGATGFIGRNLVNRLGKNGSVLKLLYHNQKPDFPENDRTEYVAGGLEDSESLTELCKETEVLIHLIGIIVETRHKKFQTTVVQGTKEVVQAAVKAGVKRIIYMSAIGANKHGSTMYFRTKSEAEEIVKSSGIEYTIFRPSLVYGKQDGFLTLQSKILKRSPVSPIIGSGKFLMQPVYIDDLTKAVFNSLTNPESINRTIEIGGPQRLEYREIIELIKKQMGIRRLNFHVPLWFMKVNARFLELLLSPPPFTVDQMRMLEEGSIADIEFMRSHLGVEPIRFEDALRYCFEQ